MGTLCTVAGALSGAGCGVLLAWCFSAGPGTLAMVAGISGLSGAAFGAIWWEIYKDQYIAIRRAANPATGPEDLGEAITQGLRGSKTAIEGTALFFGLKWALMGAIAGGGVLGSLMTGRWHWGLALGGTLLGASLGLVHGVAVAVSGTAMSILMLRALSLVVGSRPMLGATLGGAVGALLGAGGGWAWGQLWPDNAALLAVGLALLMMALGAYSGWQLARGKWRW
jgi:hypothetical protein